MELASLPAGWVGNNVAAGVDCGQRQTKSSQSSSPASTGATQGALNWLGSLCHWAINIVDAGRGSGSGSGSGSAATDVMLCGASFKLWQTSASQHFFNWHIYTKREREWEGVDRGRWSGREVVDGGGRQLEQLALCVFFFWRAHNLPLLCANFGVDVNITSIV